MAVGNYSVITLGIPNMLLISSSIGMVDLNVRVTRHKEILSSLK
jgi:hypothetical protein